MITEFKNIVPLLTHSCTYEKYMPCMHGCKSKFLVQQQQFFCKAMHEHFVEKFTLSQTSTCMSINVANLF